MNTQMCVCYKTMEAKTQMNEKKYVEQELSNLLERTLQLENELYSTLEN